MVVASPAEIERVRQTFVVGGQLRDATLTWVLSYAELRPEEALALRWDHIRERTLLVEG